MTGGPHLQNMTGLQDFCSTGDSPKSSLHLLVLNCLIRPARPEQLPLSNTGSGLQCFGGEIPQRVETKPGYNHSIPAHLACGFLERSWPLHAFTAGCILKSHRRSTLWHSETPEANDCPRLFVPPLISALGLSKTLLKGYHQCGAANIYPSTLGKKMDL